MAADIVADDQSLGTQTNLQSDAPPKEPNEAHPCETGDGGSKAASKSEGGGSLICDTVCHWLRLPQLWQSNLFQKCDPSSLAVVRIFFGEHIKPVIHFEFV